MPTIGQIIRQHAHGRPGDAAIVAPGRTPLSYRGFDEQIERVGIELRQAGLGRSARIGVGLPDGPEAALAIVAMACRAIAVPLDTKLTVSELHERFAALRLDAVLLPLGGQPNMRRAAELGGVRVIEAAPVAGEIVLHLIIEKVRGAAPAEEPDPDCPALVLQTSGTTARPKLVPITHENFLAEASKIQSWYGLTASDRCLCLTPLCYAHALRQTLFPPLITGGSVARPHAYSEADVIDWLGNLRPTWYSAFPIFHRSILEAARRRPGARISHALRFLLSAGTPLSEDVRSGLEDALGVPVLEFYGMGEAGQMSANPPPPGARKPGTCGVPWPGEVIVAENAQPLPAGELGEVLVRGPSVITGYLDNPDDNKVAFVDGWFRTGDLGAIDEGGFLTLHGRFKDVINRGGEKIAPAEVDRVLLSHPAVVDAAAFPLPHPRLGEDIAAAVVLGQGKSVTAHELRAFVGGRLARFKVPRRIMFVYDIPKDVTGKIRRRQLGEALAPVAAVTAVPTREVVDTDSPLQADLLELWRKLLKSEQLGIDDDFFEKGGDSLLAVQMLLELEQQTGHRLPETVLPEVTTIRHLVTLINKRLCRQAQPLTWVQRGNGGPSFFFFHGDYDAGGYYTRRLADQLGPEVPLVAIAPHGLGGEAVPRSIEEMATERLPLVLAAQPIGPFRLGGHCSGGSVAFEVARLLRAAGREVDLVVVIDAPLSRVRFLMRAFEWGMIGARRLGLRTGEKRFTRAMLRFWTFSALRVDEQRSRLEALLARALGGWSTRMPAAIGGRPLAAPRVQLAPSDPQTGDPPIKRAHEESLASYQPQRLDVPCLYFSAEFDGRAWKGICPDAHIIDVPGGHLGCITTQIGVLAGHLRSRLAPPDTLRRWLPTNAASKSAFQFGPRS